MLPMCYPSWIIDMIIGDVTIDDVKKHVDYGCNEFEEIDVSTGEKMR